MNDFDTGFFRWLLVKPAVGFHAWIDARRVALPNQKDLANDLVAALVGSAGLEGMCVELEAEARADALTRLLVYLARLWTEPGGRGSLPVSCVSGAILDLTGRSPARALSLRSAIAPGCRLELTVLRRHLADEDAAALLASVAAGEISPWLLGWVPLMRGGGESAIIVPWRLQVERRLADERDRADLGSLTLIFATLAGCRPAWEHGLKRWNMKTSPFLDEIRAEGRAEGREEGRAEGREEGRAEGREKGRAEEARALVLRQGRQKFAKDPAKKQQKQLEGITDLATLEALAERLLAVDSWAELLAGRNAAK